jgi:hypothetical protein
MGSELEDDDSDTDNFNEFAERHGLPGNITRNDIERLVARGKKLASAKEGEKLGDWSYTHRGPHGRRGKEPRDKRELGEKPVPLFDWKAHRPETWPDRLTEYVKKHGGNEEEDRRTVETQMDLIADFARLEHVKIASNDDLIGYGEKRKHVLTDFDAKRLRYVFA